MKAGVRNKFTGEIIEIKRDSIMAEVVIQSGDKEITSIMTSDSLDESELRVGDTVTALIKRSMSSWSSNDNLF